MQLGTTYAVDPLTFIRSQDWTDAGIANATLITFNAGKRYGWTAADIGSGLGFSAAQVAAHFAKYGLHWVDPAQPGVGVPMVSDTSAGSLLSNPWVLGGGALLLLAFMRR